ncbi:MAG: type II toxin-antitoxin system HicA family toxin [Gammaproteobacteria bacterium]|nr:type II toxin-antitoxin system HicA family toxin [Gammaproteobacteria bacterium]MYB37409.1 type II toxin-antitoxin system HicA family toxin [Gammaproteobacteria bacterium]
MAWKEYRDVVAILQRHDRRFEVHLKRGKGSHRMLMHPDVQGRKRHYPVPYHGAKTPIAPGMLREIVRVFELPEDLFD